jgi:hypothetical protein
MSHTPVLVQSERARLIAILSRLQSNFDGERQAAALAAVRFPRAATLAAHGATPREIEFLRYRRVELNAMPSDVFVQFLERKLTEHGVRKVVPDDDVLKQHARHIITHTLLNKALDEIRPQVETEVALVALPADLRQQVEADLERQSGIPWDLAVTRIAKRTIDGEGAL